MARPTLSPIGIDLGSANIKALQVASSRSGLSIVASTIMPRKKPGSPIDAHEFSRLARVLSRQGFRGTSVVLGTPTDKLITVALELPPKTSGAPLNDIARAELARAGRTEPSAIEAAWWELPAIGRTGEGTHGLGVACKHEDAAVLLDSAEQAGLSPLALDALPSAIVRAVLPLCPSTDALTGILDLGFNSCELLLLSGRTLVYQRSMKDFGTGRLLTALSQSGTDVGEATELLIRRIGCSSSEQSPAHRSALEGSIQSLVGQMIDGAADELRMSVSYAQRRFGGELSRVLLVGCGADLPGVCERSAKRLSVDVRLTRADDLAASLSDDRPAGPGMVQALGLALHTSAGGDS